MRTLHIDRRSPRRRIPNGLDKVDSLLRSRLRTTLTLVGLLSAARSVRDSVRSVQHLADNAPFWFRGTPDRLPAPPVNLVRLTTGTFSLDWMFQSGALAASSIVTALAKNGVRLDSLDRMLDFGCGCGRVVDTGPALNAREVYGCDYNPRPINWCRRRLTFARFATNGLHPPLPHASGRFDLVICPVRLYPSPRAAGVCLDAGDAARAEARRVAARDHTWRSVSRRAHRG